ncbi:MAG: GNAT family N-acetyltransferase [Acidimicrobiia bacterium]
MAVIPGLPVECFRLPPLAPRVGPFPHRDFLVAWWEQFNFGTEIMVVANEGGTLPLMKTGDRFQVLGDSDLTDYHSPLGRDMDGITGELLRTTSQSSILDLDSLPIEAAEPLAASLGGRGLRTKVSAQVIAMVLALPPTVDEYYGMISARERHELRRKRRRYEEQIGPAVLRTYFGGGFGFDEFVRLHRLAPGDKGGFLTGARWEFFARLAAQEGWRVDLLEHRGAATACLFGWSDGSDYYLYNSSFDPRLQATSPGLVLLTAMIEYAIDQRWGVFDFLKGDEAYKKRLGAQPRQLFRVEAWR